MREMVWVTGSGSKNGIGYAICKALSNREFEYVALDVKFDEDVIGDYLNIADELDIRNYFDEHSLPSHIVNCAGVNITDEFVNYDMGNFDKVYDVNVRGTFMFTREFIKRAMKFSGPKFIINIGSESGSTPRTNSVVYCSSKAAISMFTKSWAREFAKNGFRVIELAPSLVLDTNMDIYINNAAARLQGKTSEEIKRYRISKAPIGRFAIPGEIAAWVPFLLENGEYANGSCIHIAGGISG